MISLRKFVAPFILFFCVASNIAQAQPVPDQILKDQENIIIREQEQRRLEQERILGDHKQVSRPKSQKLELLSGQESACFDVQEIVLLGELKEPVSEIKSELVSFEGRCLGSVGLQNVLRQIPNYYIERGFVTTRAYLEPQDISAGRLEVLVVEGRVSDVVILEGDKRRSRTRQITGNRKDQILNIRDFEQGLDQVNRLGSKTAKIRIEPGDTIGSSRVFIDVQDSYTVDASAQVSNEGSKSTGRHQLSGSVSVEDALGFYENLTVTAKTSLDYLDRSLYSRSINGYVSVPWHYLTLSMSGSFQQYASELTSAAGSYAYNGDSWEARIGADYVAYRDKIKQVLFSTGLTLKESRNFITGRYIPASSKRLSVLDISGALSAQVLQGAGTVKLSFLKGIDAFAAHSDTIFSDNVPRGQFSKVELDASWRKNWQSTAGLMGFSGTRHCSSLCTKPYTRSWFKCARRSGSSQWRAGCQYRQANQLRPVA
ncbi:ShlB/FhaC/HecB family hemolysin secretion/activation protein [Pseudovibrio sp. Ad37]|uniref:ShlB/FhaC/HecB family hemolysin secretion/activation protein n=1 Tax=Pseudovibrio sp. Ad37 TaxID=989422 RepID=UPI0007AE8C1D|nr:ShlB/FhaC/HecB family hemolysin secretion/activation protein [Pseudovibrio sp. Ad37]KZL14858.1 Hemolysin transporter protein ShlB precursor [Pseudovibrio sp. Ad37]